MKKEKKPKFERKSHGIQLLLRCVVRDPDGKIISDTGRNPARSFVRALLQFVGAVGDAPGPVAVKATDGGNASIYNTYSTSSSFFRGHAGINNAGYGIVVGTGDTAETNTDWILATQLGEGVGAGQITHGATVVGPVAVVGVNVDMVMERSFSNNTGSTITVKEAGIYARQMIDPHDFCIVRDVLPSPVDVPDKCSVSIYYTWRTTV